MGAECCKFRDQDESLTSHPEKDEELVPLDKKKIFIEALKKEYAKQYDAIQPIPYIKDRLYSVNKIFVEGGTEIYHNQRDTWNRVESYNDVYRDFRATETLHILEGEAGYGKSTVTLQLAYDWCNGVTDSPLANTEILILLKLRQLSGFNSLYQAIKRLLVRKETNISSIDIKDIIESCTSVEFLLDGYDEYPERDQDTSSELVRVIRKETLKGLIVSLTTRHLPNELEIQTHKRARLLGFDEKSRDQYIRKAVVKGDNKKQIEKIKSAFSRNPVLGDLCQVPLFFVMFAHMTHEKEELSNITSVTEFFSMMLKCFHSHLRNKSRDKNTKAYMTGYEFDHKELSSVAFESLSKRHRHFSWGKHDLRKRLGHGFYQHYIAVGILKEEEVPDSGDDENDESENIDDKTEVMFFHNLFCEWYASFDLIEKVASSENTEQLHELLDSLDPFDFQYLYRFSCGNNPTVGNKIIQYLKDREGCDKFAILCILERSGDVDEIEDIVTKLCAKTVVLQTSDSKLFQRSVIQLLEIANNFRIHVPHLVVDRSLISMKQDEPAAKSGDILPILATLKNLEVKSEKGRELAEAEVIGMINYGKKHGNLKALTLRDALLPLFFDVQAVSSTVMTTTFSVFWRQQTCKLRLDSQSGRWEIDSDEEPLRLEVCDWQTISQMCKHAMHFRTTDSRQLQRSTILLMEAASIHSLSVPSVVLDNTFSVASQNEIELTSGLRVPILSSMKMLEVKTDLGTEFTEQQVLDVLSYGKQCQRMTQISFLDCLVPLYFSNDSLPFLKTMEHINVLWQPSDKRLWFNFASGQWKLQSQKSLILAIDSIQSLPKICRDAVVCRWGDIEEHTRTLIVLLEIASLHGVPISGLILERGQICTDKCELNTASGITVPVLTTLQSLELRAEKGTEFTQTDVLRAVTCGQRYPNLEKLTFSNCVLPLTLPDHSFSSRFQVLWKPGERELGLDSSNGKWTLHSKRPITFEIDQKNSLSELCAESVLLGSEYSKEHTRSLVLLLEIASDQNLPISCLVVEKSQMSPDQSEGFITASGVLVPILETLKSLELSGEKGQELTKTDVEKVMSCGKRFQNLEKITFSNCLLPLILDDISLGSTAQVSWKPLEHEFPLHVPSGKWKLLSEESLTLLFDDDNKSLPKFCSDTVIIRSDTREEHKKAMVLLLEVASNYNIQIQHLVVESNTISGGSRGLKIQPGVWIPALMTLETLEIKTEKGQELENHTVLELLNYVMECPQLTKITFIDCLLPLSFSDKTILSDIQSKDLQVFWRPSNHKFCLDDSNGKWEVKTNKQSIWIDHDGDNTLTKLCRGKIYLRRYDSHERQRTMILLLEIASNHQIPISKLCLERSFRGFDGDNIRLESGLCISSLSSVEKISINGGIHKNEISEGEVTRLLNFGLKSRRFKELWFSNCKLPPSINPASIPEEAKSRNAKVFSSNEALSFNLDTGEWTEPEDIETIKTMCSDGLIIHNRTRESVQRSVVELMVKATDHDIPMYRVSLIKSFDKIDEDGLNIILKSGLFLPNISSMEVMLIQTEKGREMKEEEVNGILNYLQQNKRLKRLSLYNCVLPSRIHLGPAAHTLESRNVEVFWIPDGNKSHQQYLLDLTRGHWDKDRGR